MFDKIVLGSKSPRRQALIQELGFPVEIRTMEVEEDYPETLKKELVPEFLAEKKSLPLRQSIASNEMLLTSDTVVLINGEILGKPENAEGAKQMLRQLSGNTHEVITGVCLYHRQKTITFSATTKVFFSDLNDQEINHYVEQFKPFDKAGSYGIQEWIGYIGVRRIEGCYYNVMGLPLHDIYQQIKLNF